jgi:8-oxo-dGTP pyrophosphatase MutT (NUDIX family)
MPREISAGGVVLRRIEDEWRIAAIVPQCSSNDQEQGKAATLALPKGLVDPGEKPEQTAVREVREETGLDATLVTKLTDIRYVYVRSWGDGQRVFKIVSFYLLLYVSGEIGNITPEMKIEVSSAKWIPLNDAPKRLSYKGERDVVRLAQAYIEAHPELLDMRAAAGKLNASDKKQ